MTVRQEDPNSRFATGDRTNPFEVDPDTDGDVSSTSKQNLVGVLVMELNVKMESLE